MDPALWEMLAGDGDDEVEAIIRLSHPGEIPPGVRLVARFGETIATCRLRRHAIPEIRANEACASLKAPRLLTPDPVQGEDETGTPADKQYFDSRRPAANNASGRGVVLGIIDWGMDFVHPNFRHADGTTRLLALWDQRRPRHTDANPYRYGTQWGTAELNEVLASEGPYELADYHPAAGDPDGEGAHGTHVMDIAAGNGLAGGPIGVAPEADLVFVHLATRGTGGLANLGDAVTLLEAVDFVRQTANGAPCCINLSMGAHGGPHDGTTLVEQALDALLESTPNLFISQSTGNYFRSHIHATGTVRQGESRSLEWWTDAADRTPNELEVWYSGRDVFGFGLRPPDSEREIRVSLGERAAVEVDGQVVGRIYHRNRDPNNADNHIDVFLDPGAPTGPWYCDLEGLQVVQKGAFHAWVERDAACRHCQSRFAGEDADASSTTGTICNGRLPLVVGAYDAHSPTGELAVFSSMGPTRDHRAKPDLVAPGVEVLAARSAARDTEPNLALYVRKSGTSMAAPHVAGAMALIAEIVPRPITMDEMRRLILENARAASVPPEDLPRAGAGYLDVESAIRAARALDVAESPPHDEREVPMMATSHSGTVAQAIGDGSPVKFEPTARAAHEATAVSAQQVEGVASTGVVSPEPGLDLEQEKVDSIQDYLHAESPISREPLSQENGPEAVTHLYESQLDRSVTNQLAGESRNLADSVPEDLHMSETPDTDEGEKILDGSLEDTKDDESQEHLANENTDEIDDKANPEAILSYGSVADWADRCVASDTASRSSGEFLDQILRATGAEESRSSFLSGMFPSATALYAAFADEIPALRREFESSFEVLARPRDVVTQELMPGDVLIRNSLEGNFAHVAILASGDVYRLDELDKVGLIPEIRRRGTFAQVVETWPVPHNLRDGFTRRLTRENGRLARGHLLLRLRPQATEAFFRTARNGSPPIEQHYRNDPNRYRNRIVRISLDELNRVLRFDERRVLRVIRAADTATLNRARIILEKIWDERHADKWLALLAHIRREAGPAAHRDIVLRADNALRQTLQAAMARVPRDQVDRFGAALSTASRIADVAGTIISVSEIVADAIVASAIMTGAVGGSTAAGAGIVMGLATIGAGVAIIGMPLSILAGLHELGSISMDAAKIPFINGYARYLNELADGRTPNPRQLRSTYRPGSRARFDQGWAAAERSVQEMIRQQGGRAVALSFLLLRREHPDSRERWRFLARRIALPRRLSRYMHGWRYDGVLTGSRGSGPRIREVVPRENAKSLQSKLEVSDAKNVDVRQKHNESVISKSQEDIMAFPPLGQPQLSAIQHSNYRHIDIRAQSYDQPPESEFVYFDCGRWGTFGRSVDRHFGLIYGTGDGDTGFAAICRYTGQSTQRSVARQLQQISQLRGDARLSGVLERFLTHTQSELLQLMDRPSQPKISVLNGINTQGQLVLLLGDLHLPVWRPGQQMPQGVSALEITSSASQTLVRLSPSIVSRFSRLGPLIGSIGRPAATLTQERWQQVYGRADIFGDAANDLNDFLGRLESWRSPPIHFVQLGDMLELWVGLPKYFAFSGGQFLVPEPTDRLPVVSQWIQGCRSATRVNGESLVDRLHQLDVPNKLWVYGNHDNYLRSAEVCRRANLPARYMDGRRLWDRGMSVWVEHGHHYDSVNRDRDSDWGWAITQAAFLVPDLRDVQSYIYGNYWDRDRNTALEGAVRKARSLTSGSAGRQMKVFAMGHTHSPFLSQIKVYSAQRIGITGYLPTRTWAR